MKIKWDRPILPAVLAVILTVLLAGCGLTDLKKTSEELKTLVLEQAEGLMGEAEEETQEEERKADRKSSDKDTDSSQEQEAGETEEPAEEAERIEVSAEKQMEYSDNYIYQTLDDEAKQVYHEVLTAALEHTEKVAVSTLDIDVLEKAYKAVCADYGGFFWMSGYWYTPYNRGGGLFCMGFFPQKTIEDEERM